MITQQNLATLQFSTGNSNRSHKMPIYLLSTGRKISGTSMSPARYRCTCGNFFMEHFRFGEQLRARKIQVDGKCKSCGLPESIDHLFLNCGFSQQVWRIAPVSPDIESSGSLDLRSTWENLWPRKSLPPTGVVEGPLAPWILWQL